MIIEQPAAAWKDYELIDCGNSEKLERFGQYVMIRPEPKALWDRTLPEKEWMSMAHTRFTPGAGFSKAGKEDSGSWNMLKRMQEQWNIRYNPVESKSQGEEGRLSPDFKLRLGLTSFKHVGVFPEQAPNWDYIYKNVKEIATNQQAKPKILNLFAYTGAASLAAKCAGGDVTHLDSVKQVVTWAKGNMELSGLDNIRWIIEDALKFVKREVRRGNKYQGLMLDPPAYGHGTDGEKWKLDECLFEMLKCCNQILAPENSFMVLNLYSNGYSAVLADTLVRSAFGNTYKSLDYGELVLRDRFNKVLPLSVFSRLRR